MKRTQTHTPHTALCAHVPLLYPLSAYCRRLGVWLILLFLIGLYCEALGAQSLQLSGFDSSRENDWAAMHLPYRTENDANIDDWNEDFRRKPVQDYSLGAMGRMNSGFEKKSMFHHVRIGHYDYREIFAEHLRQAGWSNVRVNRNKLVTTTGIKLQGLFSSQLDDSLSFGIAWARRGGGLAVEVARLNGETVFFTTRAIGLAYRTQITHELSIKGDMQHVYNANDDRKGFAGGLKLELKF